MFPWWVHQLLSTLSFVLTLVFVSSILRRRQPAGSTLAWLLFIFVVPYIGIPLYFFLGGRKFRANSKKSIYIPSSHPSAGNSASSIQKILSFSGVPPAENNELLELLPDGVAAYKKIMSLIHEASKTIFITTFILGNDSVGKEIVSALSEKARSGVEVRILVDSLGATWVRLPSFRDFRAAGGKVAYFMPLFHIPLRGRTNLRNHRKLMVVDSKFAIIGGMNIAQEYMGPLQDPKRWVDLGALIDGASVSRIEEIFVKDWLYATHAKSADVPTKDPKETEGRFQAQVVASGPDVVFDPLYDVLLSAIHESKKSVRIVTPYFIPDEALTKALELAAKRGVHVHVILPRKSNHLLADVARGSFIRQLAGVGVQFGFYPRMIHAKALLVDQTLAVLGSANFDMRSLLLNYELGLVIYTREILEQIEHWIVDKENETTHEIASAGYFRETLEGIGRLMGPVL